jgi:hypothetical protein
MIATAWDNIPQTSPQQEVSPEEEIRLQGKLHIERLELADKIEKLKTFITMNPKYQELEHYSSRLLEDQLAAMQTYENVLVQRMTLLNNPNNN